MYKQEKMASKYVDWEVKSEEQLLNELMVNKKVYEEEINRIAKTITIGNRVISYDVPLLQNDEDKEEFIMEVTMDGQHGFSFKFEGESEETCGATYRVKIDWGDGNIEEYESSEETFGAIYHNYSAGVYDITISGQFEVFLASWQSCITKIKQWGNVGLRYFSMYGCDRLVELPVPSKNSFIGLEYISFEGCDSLDRIPTGFFKNCPLLTNFNSTFRRMHRIDKYSF